MNTSDCPNEVATNTKTRYEERFTALSATTPRKRKKITQQHNKGNKTSYFRSGYKKSLTFAKLKLCYRFPICHSSFLVLVGYHKEWSVSFGAASSDTRSLISPYTARITNVVRSILSAIYVAFESFIFGVKEFDNWAIVGMLTSMRRRGYRYVLVEDFRHESRKELKVQFRRLSLSR